MPKNSHSDGLSRSPARCQVALISNPWYYSTAEDLGFALERRQQVCWDSWNPEPGGKSTPKTPAEKERFEFLHQRHPWAPSSFLTIRRPASLSSKRSPGLGRGTPSQGHGREGPAGVPCALAHAHHHFLHRVVFCPPSISHLPPPLILRLRIRPHELSAPSL